MSKIYIAGKITGTTDYMERFARAEAWLSKNGYAGSVINPAKVNAELPAQSTTYKDYVHMGLVMLSTCDTIFVLKNWEESLGTSLELQYAMTLGYTVIFEEEIDYEKDAPEGFAPVA